jgi:hypothetical protein
MESCRLADLDSCRAEASARFPINVHQPVPSGSARDWYPDGMELAKRRARSRTVRGLLFVCSMVVLGTTAALLGCFALFIAAGSCDSNRDG